MRKQSRTFQWEFFPEKRKKRRDAGEGLGRRAQRPQEHMKCFEKPLKATTKATKSQHRKSSRATRSHNRRPQNDMAKYANLSKRKQIPPNMYPSTPIVILSRFCGHFRSYQSIFSIHMLCSRTCMGHSKSIH